MYEIGSWIEDPSKKSKGKVKILSLEKISLPYFLEDMPDIRQIYYSDYEYLVESLDNNVSTTYRITVPNIIFTGPLIRKGKKYVKKKLELNPIKEKKNIPKQYDEETETTDEYPQQLLDSFLRWNGKEIY